MSRRSGRTSQQDAPAAPGAPDGPDDRARMAALLRSGVALVAIATAEEAEARLVAIDAAGEVSRPCRVWSVTTGLRDATFANESPDSMTMNAGAALARASQHADGGVHVFMDLCPFLVGPHADPHVIRAAREAVAAMEATGGVLVMIDHDAELPPSLRAHATKFEISYPSQQEIEAIVIRELRAAHQRGPIEIDLKRSELEALTRNLRGLSRRQARLVARAVVEEDRRLDASDLPRVIARKRELVAGSGLLEHVDAPASMDDIGGLAALKAWLNVRARSFDQAAAEFGLTPPRGVLLLGVQGAGKSLCAKAIATAWARPLLRLDPSSLYDRFVGESERRLRDALAQADASAPVVLWVDEIEKAFASAGAQSADGGLSQRMFGTLLTWMQEHASPVFLVATANNIDALPPELMRKGRFDEIFFVDLPGPAARRAILEIHLRRRRRDPAAFDIPTLVDASRGRSGAEIEQAIIDALHAAFDSGTELDTGSIRRAIGQSPPLSVTMRERIDALRAWARGRCVPADDEGDAG